MSRRHLRHLLSGIADHGELTHREPLPVRDPLRAAWRSAADDALEAYESWLLSRGADDFAVYRAYADRADAAQDALAAAHGRPTA
jgi:hypothetical protein